MRRSKGKNTLSGQFRKLKKRFPTEYNTIKIGIVFAIIFIPVMIWGAYLFGFRLFGIPTNIDAGDALLYWGSVLTFLGTATLGAFAMAQNGKLNETNRLLLLEQNKPILSIIPFDASTTEDCPKVLLKFSELNGILNKEGWEWKRELSFTTFNLKIENIGLGPALSIRMYLYQVTSVDGVSDLDNIKNELIDNIYEKIRVNHYQYSHNKKTYKKQMDLYTFFNLGITETSNRLCLSIQFSNIQRMHSILELAYSDTVGKIQYQLFYFSRVGGEAYYHPSSKVYETSKEQEINE